MSQPEVFETLRSLLRAACECGMECPEVLAEEDGDIAFDWGDQPRHVLSVSVSEHGRLSWASLVGDSSTCGQCFGGVDAALLDAMKQYAAPRTDAD